jgi:hypothetical protein
MFRAYLRTLWFAGLIDRNNINPNQYSKSTPAVASLIPTAENTQVFRSNLQVHDS